MTDPGCRYPEKHAFDTREAARDGTLIIRIKCMKDNREYQPLYPYKCPDAEHWHLSHYQQGTALCGTCNTVVPAWKGSWWVIARHVDAEHVPCRGEGSRAADDRPKEA